MLLGARFEESRRPAVWMQGWQGSVLLIPGPTDFLSCRHGDREAFTHRSIDVGPNGTTTHLYWRKLSEKESLVVSCPLNFFSGVVSLLLGKLKWRSLRELFEGGKP